ncbi:MAG: nitrilase-related carbon-nitrogen hydrolase [Oscillospiraceae bacterium]
MAAHDTAHRHRGPLLFCELQHVLHAEMYPRRRAAAEIAALPDVVCRGGSCVIDPYGHELSEPLWDREGIIYADLDLSRVPASRMEHDVCGHYARPDVLKLTIRDEYRPALRARMKVSSTFQGGGVQRQFWPPPQSAESPFMLTKAQEGLREPSPGFPFLYACTCAPILWEVVLPLRHSTPFLWCLPKETVSSRQRKALLPRRLHHSRERCCLGGQNSSSPDLGRGLVVDRALKSA